ncbi:MAG: glycerophosphodiester phosphodiesterase family protein [Clostridia bacterium]|nr:glycerophosphodiester phosphodiesterase family protein [Clostridia bacterium]
MNNGLKALARKKGVLIAAHRGVAGGNIPCNTPVAYRAAIDHGADIIELDVAISRDRKLFVFHPGMEQPHLGCETAIKDMDSAEVEKLRFLNCDRVPTTHGVSYLRDVLSELKGRCYVNIDKFWTCMEEITDLVRELDMQDQVIIKTGTKPETLEKVARIAPELPFMPIIRDDDTVCRALLAEKKLNLVGAEILFADESKPIASEEYIRQMHDMGLLIWINPIVYNYKDVLCAGHNDDISIAGSPDDGWGWLAERGYDILQTDWTMQMRAYLEEKGYRKK